MYHHHIKFLTFVIYLTVVSTSFHVVGQFSKAKLHPNCLKVGPTSKLSTEWGLRLFAGFNFYIPFGSSQAVHHISELISAGSKVASKNGNEDGAKNLCALVRIKGFKLELEGYGGNYMIQDCSVIKKGSNDCKINSRSENPEYQKNGDAITNIVWTDNDASMAVVRCSDDGLYNDWYVLSTSTSLNTTVKSTVLAAINKLGFQHNLNDTLSPTYDGCELFPPEEDDR